MIINIAPTEVKSSGRMKTNKLRIEATAKTFAVLSNALYINKKRAVIREICCNAIDGHRALKREGGNPPAFFDVKIPSKLDPVFKVRDYGIGLTDEQVDEIYTVYFASTKAGSNDDIGGFGLGSKSPFAVTDSFIVTSWVLGYKSVYNIYMRDGEPYCTRMSCTKSDEPTGVEVSVTVSTDEVYDWEREAKYVFYSMIDEFRPTGNWNTMETAGVEHGVTFADKYVPRDYDKVMALMGGVVYPIPDRFWKGTFLNFMTKNRTAIIPFDIGALDLQPSREHLSLIPETVQAIEDKIGQYNKEAMVDIEVMFATATDWRSLYRDLFDRYTSNIEDVVSNMMFRGKTFAKWRYEVCDSNINGAVRLRSVSIKRGGDVSTGKIYSGSYYRGRSVNDLVAAYNDKSPVFLINDLSTGHLKTIRGLYHLGLISNTDKIVIAHTNDKIAISAMREIMSRYHNSWKQGRVFLLSKYVKEANKILLDKGIIVKKESATTRLTAFMPDGNIKTAKATAEMIAGLDGYFVCTFGAEYMCSVTPVYKTRTFKTAPDKTYVDGFKNRHVIRLDGTAMTTIRKYCGSKGKPLYIIDRKQIKTALTNDKLVQPVDEITPLLAARISELPDAAFIGHHYADWSHKAKLHDKSGRILSRVFGECAPEMDVLLSELDSWYDVVRNESGANIDVIPFVMAMRERRDTAMTIIEIKDKNFIKKNPFLARMIPKFYDAIEPTMVDDILRLIVD